MNIPLSASEAAIKQQCALRRLYVALVIFGFIYAGGVVFFALKNSWLALFLWLVLLPSARWVSLRLSRFTSKGKAPGPVAGHLPSGVVSKAPVEVAFYFHNGCPFCPIVKGRLEALQTQMNFTLTKVDLTFRPHVAASRGIQSVPVVEVGKERLFGNSTMEQLAQLIGGANTLAPTVAG